MTVGEAEGPLRKTATRAPTSTLGEVRHERSCTNAMRRLKCSVTCSVAVATNEHDGSGEQRIEKQVARRYTLIAQLQHPLLAGHKNVPARRTRARTLGPATRQPAAPSKGSTRP